MLRASRIVLALVLVFGLTAPAPVGAAKAPASAPLISKLAFAPNPFYPQAKQPAYRAATVSVSLAKPARVTVGVYKGKQLIRLLANNAPRRAGSQVFAWNGLNAKGKPVSQGIYGVLVTAKSGKASRALAGAVVLRAGQPPARKLPNSVAVQALKWKKVTTPQGRAQLEIPDGWAFGKLNQEENPIIVAPAGQEKPSIGFLGGLDTLVASFFANGVAGDVSLMAKQYSAQEFFEQFLFPILKKDSPDLKVSSIVASSPAAADALYTYTLSGRPIKAKAHIDMLYYEDPTAAVMIGASQAWYSFAFISEVAAPPEVWSQVEALGARVLKSFRPTEKWLAEVRNAVIGGMQFRMARIGQTISRVNQMEINQRLWEMQSNYNVGRNWIHALGGTVELKHPDGTLYTAPDKYKYYYESGGYVYGTDDHTQLTGLDRTSLTR